MGRFWSLLFILVPILGVGCFVVAAMPDSWPIRNHWFPEDVSEHGYIIDNLFYFILFLTGAVFVGTGSLLGIYAWKYDAEHNKEPVKYTHGNHTLEVVWSILPAVTLLFIAIYQMDAWAGSKLRRPTTSSGTPAAPIAEVTGRQFEWRIRYPGEDGILGTRDDLHTVNDLHVPVNQEVTISIKSMDVLHSFFLPNLRVKQDLVPGMKQFTWFKATREGQFDIVCAELCGWGHYKMKGRLTVESQASFEKYLDKLRTEQNQTTLAAN